MIRRGRVPGAVHLGPVVLVVALTVLKTFVAVFLAAVAVVDAERARTG